MFIYFLRDEQIQVRREKSSRLQQLDRQLDTLTSDMKVKIKTMVEDVERKVSVWTKQRDATFVKSLIVDVLMMGIADLFVFCFFFYFRTVGKVDKLIKIIFYC